METARELISHLKSQIINVNERNGVKHNES